MIGHGRPTNDRAALRRPRAGPWRRLRVGVLLALWAWLGSAAYAAPTTLRLRVAWGGGSPRQWQGSIRLSNGDLSQVRALGIEADEPGSIYLDRQAVVVAQPSPRADDGFDVLVTAELDDRLIVALEAVGEAGPAPTVEIPLADLLHQSRSATLDPAKNRLLVMRTPGDRLRVELPRESLVYAPGEALEVVLTPHLLDAAPGASVRVRAVLLGPGGEKAWTQDFDCKVPAAQAPFEPIRIQTSLPQNEGVYELTLAASTSRAPWSKPVAERSVQFVVVADSPVETAPAPALAKTIELDPANPRWWDRLTTISLVPGVRKGPLGTGDAARWEHPQFGPLMQLGRAEPRPEPAWEAYPLPIDAPGQVHLLELEYPSDVPQSLGISIVEPNSAGAVMPIGLDSGVYVSDEQAGTAPRMLQHRLPFWPRTKTPLLLVTSRRPGARAVYGKIRVLGPASSQLAGLSLSRTEARSRLPRAESPGRPPERLLAAYWERPYLAENFSATEQLDPFSRRSLDDWRTFYQGATRLVDYLHYQGYNAAVVSVLDDGSSLYPSQLLQPTPQHDTGVYFSTGQDPYRKDVLELLLRVLDREGLQCLPAVHFNAPLPALEEIKRRGEAASVGLEWIGADGRTVDRSRTGSTATAPRYNPLHPLVQEAMLDVVRELVERCAPHPSFAGLALQLSGDGCAQLPPWDGGYDDQTIARFQRDTRSTVPGRGPGRFAERARYLTGPGQQAWLQWRAAQLAEFHRRLHAELAALAPRARLYLTTAALLDHPQIARALRPALPPRANFEQQLLRLGLRAENYAADEGIVLLRPQRLAPLDSLAARGSDLEINDATEIDRLFALSTTTGSLLYHEPQRARLASFDARSPFGAANTYLALVSQLSPSGERNRQRFAHSLATLDSQVILDGGWLLPLGQEDSLRNWISAYRQLPAQRFRPLAADTQPVAIRTLTTADSTYVYLVNDSPWPVGVTLRVSAPPGCQLHQLGTGAGLGPLPPGQGPRDWTIDLPAYELAAARFDARGVQFTAPRVRIPDEAPTGLHRRIQDLGARAAALGKRASLPLLENPGMERTSGSDEIPGWEAAAPAGTRVDLDTIEKRSGRQSIKLTGNGPRVAVRSNEFAAPATGRLSVEIWLRVDDPSHQPSVRLAVEGQREHAGYVRYAMVGGHARGAVPLGQQWAQYIFQVDDLPAAGPAAVRVSFELAGPGQVSIDDVQLFDLAFNEVERTELAKLISLAQFKLQSGKVSECARLLDGYWPQFLLAHVPLTVTPSGQPPAQARQPAAPRLQR